MFNVFCTSNPTPSRVLVLVELCIICNLLSGLFVPTPNLLLVLFQNKFVGCDTVLVPLPTNIEPGVKVDAPVPPHLADKTPYIILLASKDVKSLPEPEITPDNLILPDTSKFVVGSVFPTPTLPEESIVIEL